MDICDVFELFGVGKAHSVERIKDPEDGTYYSVWRITSNGAVFVVKKAKGKERSNYREFFSRPVPGVPRCFGSVSACGDDYLLLSCENGHELLRCGREEIKASLDALISIQNEFWGDTERAKAGLTFEESVSSRAARGKYLYDAELETCYAEYMRIYKSLPRTLCHNDLLPFNVIYGGGKAVIVDWEEAGILPYLTPLARFIAHCFEDENAFFYMTDEDKEFAKEYYYVNLIKEKGIEKSDYLRALDYFIFYEYCEWIMLMNKYPDSDKTRGEKYYKLAKALALRLA